MSKADIASLATSVGSAEKAHWIDRFCRRLILRQLQQVAHGEISITENGQTARFGRMTAAFPVSVHLEVRHSEVWRAVALSGSVGAGETFIKGAWTCDNLTGLVRIFLRNRAVLDRMDTQWLRLKQPLDKLLHRLQKNTRAGSRRNISAHYDLGNRFFRLFLDESMMYSSAIFRSPTDTLEQASRYKLDHVCRQLALTPHDHVLEIGTGWGGMALHAAQHYGCRVTTTTLSQRQYDYAQRRVQEAGLSDRVTLLLKDYRDLEGHYDKLVSIEMIEAVGHQYLETYFKKCHDLLKPDGLMLLQAITIKDQHYKRALREVDFIKKYVFPGGFLPSLTAMCQGITRATPMTVVGVEDIGAHYARTLKEWRYRFLQNVTDIRQQGYSEQFRRLWEFYFCYCEGGFKEADISTVQMLIRNPR